MRSAIISGVLLVCIVLLITANSFYCTMVTKELAALASPERVRGMEDVEALDGYWNRHKNMLHLGVNSSYTDAVSEGIAELRAAVKTNSETDIAASLELLKLNIKELEKLNKLDWVNVF